ncbi:Hypothetical protein R9X50_00476000 [Acrodontium crateriforme]|uniref:Uncharacterized protein n=1 Tax=Acrodontium crateriforme TaxID=150365 RepID=A0AAQ3RAD7_9PEZI|nr:Hypothetical protein R9X50_00476000 [Acrodontium crateriforme]
MSHDQSSTADQPNISNTDPPPSIDTPAHEIMSNERTDGDEPVYGPPPHLAAKFYRDRVARRKSSATSSRRNSFSSAQSHTSSRASHRRNSSVSVGCQSNYIAQHLRRNSIIESRRARLADRAAHAEQVRLRAALAKAQPRGSISAHEERALAAQVAKEKYLAKVAATCAEEVARAKRIAEEVKERKLAEETRQRLEMEERHAEAQKRRAEYQRNLQERRARRADSSEKKLAIVEELGDVDEEAVEDDKEVLLDNESAARRIQRAWRLSRRLATVNAFNQLDMNAKRAESTSFEDMTALIADTKIINISTALLMLLNLQDANDKNATLNTRTFLSAYLIIGNPVAVLNNKNGSQEQDLISKSTDLVQQFQATKDRLARWNEYTPNATQLEALSQAYSSYTSAFAAWRLQDSSVLIEGMVASFVELDAIWQTVKDDTRGEVASDYREGIRDNQVMLLSRIRKLAGPDRADFLIKKAIRESRRRRPKRRNAAEVRPRVVEAATSSTDTEQAERAVDAAIPDMSDVDSADITRKLFTPMPSNRVLTHELAIDKDFTLSDDSAALRDEVYRYVCEAMKHGFESGDGSLWTISAAENVREKLLRMLKPGNSMYQLISETLDLDQIARQCRAGIFSYDGFFGFMANILPKVCAPFRDREIAEVCETLQPSSGGNEVDVMTNKLFRLLRAVDMLGLDYSNFMLTNVAPTLIREAAGYEARQFSSDLENGRTTLSQTKIWWRTANNILQSEADRRDPEGVNAVSGRPKTYKIYARGLLDLAIEQGILTKHAVPETLALDADRFQIIREQALRITVIGAVLLTAKNLLKRDVRGQWKNEATRLWSLLSAETFSTDNSEEPNTAQKAFSILETAHNMPPATKAQLSGTITRLFSQAAATQSTNAAASPRFTDPVLKVLFTRLRTHVLARLSASTSSEKVRAASSASDALTSIGLGEMVTHVGTIVNTLDRVRIVDWQAHGQWYEQVASEIDEERTIEAADS